MKETNRDEIWQNIEGEVPYGVRVNPELNQLLAALADILDGKKVMVLFREDMPRDDDWQPIPLLPLTWFQVPKVLRKTRSLSYWAQMASHLVRPMKTIWLGTDISSRKLRWIDRLMGYHLHHASQWIDVSEIDIQGFSFPSQSSAFGFQEWKVNVGRLFMELCKEIHFRGGIVLNYAEVELSGEGVILYDLVTGAKKLIKSQIIAHGGTATRPEVDLGLPPWSGFFMRVPFHDDFLELIDREGKLKASMILSKDYDILVDAVQNLLGTDVHEARLDNRQAYGLEVLGEPPLKKLQSFRLMAAPNVDGSPVEDIMETAFDISKQTGVSFQEFRDLYYRYGTAMDNLTEEAYQLMNQTREYSFIWEKVIQDYCEKYEWKIRNQV